MKALGLLAAVPVFAVALQLPLEAQEVVVKMATLVPDGSRWHLILKENAEKWKIISGGRVVVRLYPGGVAGDDQGCRRQHDRVSPVGAVFAGGVVFLGGHCARMGSSAGHR